MRNVILFRHHDFKPITMRHLRKLEFETDYEVWAGYDKTGRQPFVNNEHDIFNYDVDDYCASGFVIASEKQIDELPSAPPNTSLSRIIYYNPEYANILFMRWLEAQNIIFDYLWYIEYDVCYHGYWDGFFKTCESSTADFLGVHIRRYPDDAGFAKFWRTFNWSIDKSNYYGAYGTINRYSRRALETLEKCYLGGKHGFYETIVPSLLKEQGLRLADINMCDWFYATATMNGGGSLTEWTEQFFKDTRNMLFHPVKKDYRDLGFNH